MVHPCVESGCEQSGDEATCPTRLECPWSVLEANNVCMLDRVHGVGHWVDRGMIKGLVSAPVSPVKQRQQTKHALHNRETLFVCARSRTALQLCCVTGADWGCMKIGVDALVGFSCATGCARREWRGMVLALRSPNSWACKLYMPVLGTWKGRCTGGDVAPRNAMQRSPGPGWQDVWGAHTMVHLGRVGDQPPAQKVACRMCNAARQGRG